MTHEPLATQAILQRMKDVRRDLDEDVQEIVEGARDMGKWRYYVRTYPWLCLGAAVAAGYLIVPRRSRGPRLDTQTANASAEPSAPQKDNATGMLLGFVGNLVMRGVSAYVGQQADKLFATPAPTNQQDDQR